MTPLASLTGSRIRRIDAPEPELLAISLIGRELRAVLVIGFAGERTGVGLVDQRPQGQPASSLVQKLRKEIDGARLAGFEQLDDATLALQLTRAEVATQLRCDFRARALSRPLARVRRALAARGGQNIRVGGSGSLGA